MGKLFKSAVTIILFSALTVCSTARYLTAEEQSNLLVCRQAIQRVRPCIFIGEGMGILGGGASCFVAHRWLELQPRIGILPPLSKHHLTRITIGPEINFFVMNCAKPARLYIGALYFTTLKGLFKKTYNSAAFDGHIGLSFKIKAIESCRFDARIGINVQLPTIFTLVYGIGVRI